MDSNSVGRAFRRRSRAEADRLVSEFEQSGLGRKEFCAMRGLSIHTLDVWRRRVAQCAADEKIVPVEIVADCVASKDRMLAASVTRSCQFRIVLAQGISIEVEPGFDAGELRRLVAALDDLAQRPEFRQLSTLLTSRSFVRVQSQGLVSRNQRLESLGGLARELRYA